MKKQILVIILLAILLVSCLALTACTHTCEFGEWTVTKQPTCTQDGLKERVCECGKKYEIKIPRVEHTAGDWIIDTMPTSCAVEGSKHQVCAVCGLTINTESIIIDHTEVVDTPVVATYGNAGLTSGSHCDVCGEVIIEQVTIPSLSEVDGSDIVVESGYYDDDEAIHYNYSYSLTINDDDTFTLVTMIVGSDESFSLEYDTGRLVRETTLADGVIVYKLHFENDKAPMYIRINGNYFAFCRKDGSDLGEKSKKRFEGTTDIDITLPEGHNTYGYYDLANNVHGRDMQRLYRELLHACEEFLQNTTDVTPKDGLYSIATIQIRDYVITPKEAVAVWKVFCGDNPGYYWLSNTLTLGQGNDFNLCIDPAYASADYRAECDQTITQMVIELDAEITDDMSDLSKAKIVHNFVINRMDYAYENDGVTPQDDIWAHNMIGCAKYNWGVCESYAKTYMYLCLLNDVECLYVVGDAGEPHAWNLICLDGTWYGVDCTWDDTGTEDISYSCFGMASEYLKSTHNADAPSDRGIDYWYELPDVSSRSLELVDLYEGDTFVGTFGNIDLAFQVMNNPLSDYTIRLYEYDREGPLLVSSPAVTHVVESYLTPNCNSLTIIGGIFSSADYSIAQTLLFNKYTTVFMSDVIVENILLFGDGTIDIRNNKLTFNGGYYVCNIHRIVGTTAEKEGKSEIVVNASVEFRDTRIDVFKLTELEGSAEIRQSSSFNIVETSDGSLSIMGWDVASMSKPDVVTIDKIVFCNRWGSIYISDYMDVYIGEVCEITQLDISLKGSSVNHMPHVKIDKTSNPIRISVDCTSQTIVTDLNGNVVGTAFTSVSLFDIPNSLINLPNDFCMSDVEISYIIWSKDSYGRFIDVTDCFQIAENGDVVRGDFIRQDNFIIVDNTLVVYEGEEANVQLPITITIIGESAFFGKDHLASIVIPSSVTNIDYLAFEGCTSLTTVYYAGTQEQWNNIIIGDGNEALTNATIHYNYTGE